MTDRVNVAKVRARERVVVNVDRAAARWIGALAVLIVFCWLAAVFARNRAHEDWDAAAARLQDRGWLDEQGSEDCQGRALWALGVGVGRSPVRSFQMMAGQLFALALPALAEFTYLLALLLESEVPLSEALALAEEAGHLLSARRLRQLLGSVRAPATP